MYRFGNEINLQQIFIFGGLCQVNRIPYDHVTKWGGKTTQGLDGGVAEAIQRSELVFMKVQVFSRSQKKTRTKNIISSWRFSHSKKYFRKFSGHFSKFSTFYFFRKCIFEKFENRNFQTFERKKSFEISEIFEVFEKIGLQYYENFEKVIKNIGNILKFWKFWKKFENFRKFRKSFSEIFDIFDENVQSKISNIKISNHFRKTKSKF